MKLFNIRIVATALLLAGCATNKNGITIQAVGPVPAKPVAINLTNGMLVVHSAYEVNADFNSSDPDVPDRTRGKCDHVDYLWRNAPSRKGRVAQ